MHVLLPSRHVQSIPTVVLKISEATATVAEERDTHVQQFNLLACSVVRTNSDLLFTRFCHMNVRLILEIWWMVIAGQEYNGNGVHIPSMLHGALPG